MKARAHGVTLIELVVVIALAGILAALMVNFVMPVRSYIDTTRRAALADTADTALRRISRDVHLALPNSVRVHSSGQFVELMLVRTAGRYRVEQDPAPTSTSCPNGASATPASDVLVFGATDSCFRSIGTIPNVGTVTAGDYLVVYNLQPRISPSIGGTPNANAYEFPSTGGNKAQISSASGTLVQFNNHTFTYESPGNRFFIVEGPVTYGCDAAAGTLTRYWGYTIADVQPATFSTGSSALLASGVAACSFVYESSVTAQGAGLLTMTLRLSMQDSKGTTESVNLYHTVHVNNVP